MKIVLTLVTRDDVDLIDAQIAFHLNAGVDFVIAADLGSRDGTAEVLASYANDGLLHLLPSGTDDARSVRTRIARLAATDHGADWIVSGYADEFWWPRGESLQDVLGAIPPRYGVVQALVRVFLPRFGEELFAERMTLRRSLLGADDPVEPLSAALRPVYKADPKIVIEPSDGTDRGRRVPLRAWYPIEVFRFPFRSREQAERTLARTTEGWTARSQIEADALKAWQEGRFDEWLTSLTAEESMHAAIAGGSLVVDERLRNALRALGAHAASTRPGPVREFTIPPESSGMSLEAPDIVDDASYAAECAAVGEVDLVRLDRNIRELESRIAHLEARFWPTVRRTISRVVRR